MKKLVISTLFVMQVFFVFAQNNTGFTGKVLDSKTQKPLQNVVASIQNTSLTTLTDGAGVFTFKEVAVGSQLLQIKSAGYKDQLLSVEVIAGKILDLGIVVMDEDITSEQQLSLITITENDLGDDNSGSESTSGLLQASRDVFQQTAAFNWGQARFRVRGLDNEYGTTMINGIVMNKIYDGRPQFSNWGGLNDATRNQEFTSGSAPSDYTFGGILGTQEINTRASIYRRGGRVSFSGTNTNYSWRSMGTYASGMNTEGWAFVVSASRRWAQEGYFEGTDYSANSLFASVEKKFNDHHSLGFTSIFAQNRRGKSSPNTNEVNDLKGFQYNSYWGWQNGKKRNSRDKEVEEPINILTHYWKINNNTNLNTSVSYQIGHVGNSRLDYQLANNPDPTYYKYLPSYFLNSPSSYDPIYAPDNTTIIGYSNQDADNARAKFLNDGQIDWNAMYEANTASVNAGKSVYALYEDRTDDKQWNANSIINSRLSDRISMNAGVNFRKLNSHNYQKLTDLLGGQYFLDVDPFYTGDATQSDLNNPNRHIEKGDTYGYNYNLLATTFDGFTQFKFSYKKIDFYLAESFSRSQYQRDGLYRNGIYANNSYGRSEKKIFENFGFKGGLTYKVNGRNYFDFNGAYMTKAPSMRNVFANARINNNITPDINSESVMSADASYIIKAPKFKARVTAYFAKIMNSTEVSFFYGEGLFDEVAVGAGNEDSFISEIVTGINKKNIGGEFGFEYQITSTIKVSGSAAYGEYKYDNNPNLKVNDDGQASATNSNPITDFGKTYLKGYRQSGMPQQAYSLGLEYRDPKFWWIGANVNYLADSYIDISSILRTDNFVIEDPANGIGYDGATVDAVSKALKQEKFDPVTLVNLVGGKSWKVGNDTFGLFASVNNVFDVKYKTGGFEQSRKANFPEYQADNANGTPSFGSKYFYGYGRTYFVNLYINF
ncbi:carboxypeptidase-like regulatory domain-containing protein [Flavobacterium phycosphaerae]|uniref:carboxypeptidase-like regulatory domain-containing protein n=1 Tax=Flavobacterium phycosphaerae TaxID=2697515 RepID=UPI00138A593B|nr:carboxypeptidase-like regulatory domain-containing protein [Flavobacterium phycosphaerae]